MSGEGRLSQASHKFKMLNSKKDSVEFAQIIKIDSQYTATVLRDIWTADGSWDALLTHQFNSVITELSLMHFRAAAEFCQKRFVEAYEYQLSSYKAFLRAFSYMDRWGVYPLLVMCKDLYLLACRADCQLTEAGQPATKLEEATRAINQGFSMCMTDREPVLSNSRKWGTYHLANLLFALYLRQKAFNMCNSMIRGIKTSELPALDQFPMGDQVTFRYYRGLLAFQGEDFAAAKEDLVFALEHCHRDAYRNRARILMRLTPIMMIEGIMPQSRLFHKYPPIMALYGGLARAAVQGDLRTFDAILLEKEWQLASLGTYLAVEYVRRIAVRQLLYRIYLIDGKNSRLSFERVRIGFWAAGLGDVCILEIESMLADMIAAGFIKGYLSHDHGVAVLSKQQPFPPIKSVLAATK
ncbi:COP9 signalosome (CSN) subunit [Coemansia sp. RSA 2050]|nr:COP9 signalosome (CSN) subunit [Coemansia sp. RSA 2050]KAJ2734563.1 COP9 signalosome (CSN) subunit [Coemansia sp. BCRC 34962]